MELKNNIRPAQMALSTVSVRVTQSSLQNKSVESCIISRVRGWRFKPISQAEGDVTVRQKYIFG